MVEIDELEHCAYYRGHCDRGPHVMVWNAREHAFLYLRYKFGGWIVDRMHHEYDPDKPDRIVGFTPIKRVDAPR